MKKNLVTTDFSKASKAGLHFAIQLASQQKADLTFFHVYHVMIPTAWNATKAENYEKVAVTKIQNTLNLFVEKVYKKLKIKVENKKCLIVSSVSAQTCIMEYAAENNFDFICISTRGAGEIKRFLGTNTSALINNAEVPVIAVPYEYRRTKISSILYASDLVNIEKELKRVLAFAKPLNSAVEMLHFNTRLEGMVDIKIIEMAVNKLAKYDIKLNIKNTDYTQSLVSNIEKAIKKIKPSLLVMFTEQNRTLFQKIFLSGKSAEYSFDSKVPLLVFNKS